jgi:hypothetical protein
MSDALRLGDVDGDDRHGMLEEITEEGGRSQRDPNP